ncbi:MAG TPA: MarR family transcriptional regulator [Sorangium sp.]|nr:MarR family transcriptional regulator [Sorangium sp.]
MSRKSRDALLCELGDEVQGWQTDQEIFDAEVAELLGLNRTDLRCLDILSRSEPMTASQLAEAARVTGGAVTGVLDRLEGAGLVKRVRDDADRRRITIALTPKVGRSTEAIYGPLVEEGNKALEAFSAAELEVIVKFLRLNRAVLVKHAGRLIELRKKRSARSTSG